MKRQIVGLALLAVMGLGVTGSAKEAQQAQQAQKNQSASQAPRALKANPEEELLEKAKKEGLLTWYTSMPLPDAQAIAESFTKKCGIKVEIWRAQWDSLRQKVMAAYRAGKYEVDAIEGPDIMMEALKRDKILQAYSPPANSAYPDQLKNSEYSSYRLQFFTAGYNTQLLKPQDAPKSYEDLLDPRFKGKITFEDKTIEWVAGMYQYLGEEKAKVFFEKLKQQRPSARHGQSNAVEMMSAGEIPLFIDVYNYLVEQKKKDGAPVDWIPLEPVMAKTNALAVADKSAHPNAAKLFVNYVLSVEGQGFSSSRNMIPAHPQVEANPPSLSRGFKFLKVDSVKVLDESNKWQAILDGLIK